MVEGSTGRRLDSLRPYLLWGTLLVLAATQRNATQKQSRPEQSRLAGGIGDRGWLLACLGALTVLLDADASIPDL